jgi:hypothetical protein
VRKVLVSPLRRARHAPIQVPVTARELAVLEKVFMRGWSYEDLIRAALRRKA